MVAIGYLGMVRLPDVRLVLPVEPADEPPGPVYIGVARVVVLARLHKLRMEAFKVGAEFFVVQHLGGMQTSVA
jgi:hypothetical protein